MAVKRRKKERITYAPEDYEKNIEQVEVGMYTRDKVLLYGINISVARSCSSLDDGLIPVVRRMIWMMYHDKHLLPDGRYVKVTEFLWETVRYHPHGNLSIEKTFGNIIKPWESNALLIDVDNNSGSLTGDGAAAVRYLDAKLSLYCYKCFFEEFDESIIDMVPNYIYTCEEPVVLPSKYPNFLVSRTVGIAWGNAISTPPFNLEESFRLTQALLENPDMENVYLFPDSPRGYDVIDNGTIREVCESGMGTIRARARLDYVEDGNYITVTGFVEGSVMDQIIKQVYDLIKSKKLIGITDIADKSTIYETEFWIYLKKDADPYDIIETLYKKTKLEDSISIIFNFADRTKMLQVGLKDAILEWIDRAIDKKQRYYIKQLSKKKERKMKLSIMVDILSNRRKWEKASKIVETMESDDDIITALKDEFHINSLQSDIVADLNIRQRSKSRVEKYKKDLEKIDEEIGEINSIVRSKQRIKDKIYDDLEEGIKLFGKPRNCRVIKQGQLKKHISHYRIAITRHYIKKLSPNGRVVGFVGSDDEVTAYYPDITEEDIIFVADNTGKFYKINLDKLAPCDASSKGTELLSLGIKGDVVRAIKVPTEMKEESYVENCTMVIFTASGIVKSTPLSQYIKARGEIQGILLGSSDFVCYVCIYDKNILGNNQKLIYTKNGMGIIVDLNNVTTTDRLTKGTQHLRLNEDIVQGVMDSNGISEIYIITTKGYGKQCDLDDILNATKRKDNMSRLTGLNDGDEVFRILPVNPDTEQTKIIFHMQSGKKKEMLCADIVKTTRISKGKKLIGVKRGDSIMKIKLG